MAEVFSPSVSAFSIHNLKQRRCESKLLGKASVARYPRLISACPRQGKCRMCCSSQFVALPVYGGVSES